MYHNSYLIYSLHPDYNSGYRIEQTIAQNRGERDCGGKRKNLQNILNIALRKIKYNTVSLNLTELLLTYELDLGKVL